MGEPEHKRDQAARAAWLYYIGRNTQEQIAKKLRVSRVAAHRLIAFAMTENMVKVRIDHPVASCVALSETLRERFDLEICEVVPTPDANSASTLPHLATAGAAHVERFLERTRPLVMGVGSGRTLRAVVDVLATMNRPQHKIVSVTGSLTANTSYSHYDIVMRLAEKVGAQGFVLPVPVLADSLSDKNVFTSQMLYQSTLSLAKEADVLVVGLGNLAPDATLRLEGFIPGADFDRLPDAGGVGDLLGYILDRDGNILDSPLNDRVTSVGLDVVAKKLTIAIAGGVTKCAIIRAALAARYIKGLITDEMTARRVLAAK